MKSRNVADFCKNAIGTVFLLAGAFFVCSTLLSMRAVFADPVAPLGAVVAQQAAAGTGTNVRAGASRSNPRSNNRTTNTTSRANANVNTGRTVTARATTTNATRATASGTNTSSRSVISRGNATGTSRAGLGGSRTTTSATNSRAVRARAGTTANTSRVSMVSNAIRGSKATTTSGTLSYLQNKLYTGNYSNIIDSSTGLISAEAYNNCMESYYTCMDEICTARNSAQRRCACAGRVKAFAEAETALESANEELIKVSGELALLVANKGKDVSEAFQLTDAEKVMNCVSWQETTQRYGISSDEAVQWCYSHNIYGTNGANLTSCSKPSYCTASGNNFGFDIANIDGSSSDILASLQSWAEAKAQTLTILRTDENNLLSSFAGLSDVVNGMAGIDGSLASTTELKDSLAQTWGYELFEYAHNNVCNRVLDSCFNGIYEACGTPPSSGRKCSNGSSQCPYNYNSMISVTNSGSYELNFVSPANMGYSTSNSATCFGYTSSSGDPYSTLRGPVADARRSILQKYALDANADCDAYGEQLRVTAQNIGYQKVAAQQALQQKRLEFANEERETVLANAISASTNFNQCMNEILDCYENQATYYPSWSSSRIKTYCAQVANVPSCYETMICNPSTAPFKAIIDKTDSVNCLYTADYTTNTCRNIVTLNDILNGAVSDTASAKSYSCKVDTNTSSSGTSVGNCDSAKLRESCLQGAFVDEIRNWKKATGTCSEGYEWDSANERCKVKGS